MANGIKTGGRAKGTPNRLTQVARDRIENNGDPIGFLLDIMNGKPIEASPVKDGAETVSIVPTLDQRQAAANTLARKLVADAKDRTIGIDIPKIETTEDTVSAVSAILTAVARGNITPSEGHTLSGIVENVRKAIETQDLERRLEALEARQ